MIIDTFPFNDEFDMLAIRLAITEQYVDRWIISEADRAFSGIEKPYHLSDNLERFHQYRDRIEIVKLEIDPDRINWACENRMRQGLSTALDQCADDDVIIHGDLDEVIDPERFSSILLRMDQYQRPVSCNMEMYIYRFDQRVDRRWAGSVVSRRAGFVDCQQLYKGPSVKRKDRGHCVTMDSNVGWHWTWIGPDDRIRNKVQSCIESQHRDPDQVLSAFHDLDTAAAINHKCATTTVKTQYPSSVQAVLDRYPEYWTRPHGQVHQ